MGSPKRDRYTTLSEDTKNSTVVNKKNPKQQNQKTKTLGERIKSNTNLPNWLRLKQEKRNIEQEQLMNYVKKRFEEAGLYPNKEQWSALEKEIETKCDWKQKQEKVIKGLEKEKGVVWREEQERNITNRFNKEISDMIQKYLTELKSQPKRKIQKKVISSIPLEEIKADLRARNLLEENIIKIVGGKTGLSKNFDYMVKNALKGDVNSFLFHRDLFAIQIKKMKKEFDELMIVIQKYQKANMEHELVNLLKQPYNDKEQCEVFLEHYRKLEEKNWIGSEDISQEELRIWYEKLEK